jgi:hypothetical protein
MSCQVTVSSLQLRATPTGGLTYSLQDTAFMFFAPMNLCSYLYKPWSGHSINLKSFLNPNVLQVEEGKSERTWREKKRILTRRMSFPTTCAAVDRSHKRHRLNHILRISEIVSTRLSNPEPAVLIIVVVLQQLP